MRMSPRPGRWRPSKDWSRILHHLSQQWKISGSESQRNTMIIKLGGVTERPNVPVLKTGDLARGPRVQISPPPPTSLKRVEAFSADRRMPQHSADLGAHRPTNVLVALTSVSPYVEFLIRISLAGPSEVPFSWQERLGRPYYI